MTEVPYCEVIGEVPAEYRSAFSSPLPRISGVSYGAVWGYGEARTPDSLQPEARHFFPIIELALDLSDMTLAGAREVLEVHIQQDHPNIVSKSDQGWHTDSFGEPYKRLFISDSFGTLTEDGITPDYAILAFNGFANHAVQRSDDPNAVRTILRITRRH